MILSVSRSRFMLCGRNAPTPRILDIPQTAVRDLEVVNALELEKAITSFLTASHVTPTTVAIILSKDVYFDKAFPHPSENQEEEIQSFVSHVPFSSTSFKVFRVNKQQVVVVLNRDLYESIKSILEKEHFSVVAVIPELMLEPIGAHGALTEKTCNILVEKMDYLKEHSFTTSDEFDQGLQQEPHVLRAHHALVISLVVLSVAIAAATAFFTLRRPLRPAPPPSHVSIVTPALSPTIAPSIPTPLASPSAQPEPSAAEDVTLWSVMILNGSKSSGLATTLATALTESGFATIQTGNTSTTADHTIITFSKDAPNAIRGKLVDAVKSQYPDVTQEEGDTGEFKAIITIVKSVY